MITDDQDYHVARLLILIHAFSEDGGRLESLTKLAKLDFLLRYPVFLERLLDRRRKSWPEGANPTHAERLAVESRMIRYKYGPWDTRYYALIGALVGRGLVASSQVNGHLVLVATETGHHAARDLVASSAWQTTRARSVLLKRWFDLPGSRLKKLIYAELPDAVDRPYWAQI